MPNAGFVTAPPQSTRRARDVQRAFNKAPQASKRANIIRFAYRLVHGGIYADADERCLTPLREWLPRNAAFGNRKDFGVLNCNFMAVEAGSRIMALSLEGAARAILDEDPDPLWLTNGPGRLTKAAARYRLKILTSKKRRSRHFR